MRRTFTLSLMLLLALTLGLLLGQRPGHGQGEPGKARLPGARTLIDAATYPSLQAALDALPPEGGVVQLPAGTFEITEPLRLERADVLIQGSGTATHIKNTNTEGQPALVIRHRDGDKMKKGQELWRVQLSNFRITGNEKSGHGILADRINEIYLTGVTSSYHGGDGIRLDRCYEDPRVVGCLLTYNKAVGLNLALPQRKWTRS